MLTLLANALGEWGSEDLRGFDWTEWGQWRSIREVTMGSVRYPSQQAK